MRSIVQFRELHQKLSRKSLEVATVVCTAAALVAIGWPLRLNASRWPPEWWALIAGAAWLLSFVLYLSISWAAPIRRGGQRAQFWRVLLISNASILTVILATLWWHRHPGVKDSQALTEQYMCRLSVAPPDLDQTTLQSLRAVGDDSSAPNDATAKCWPIAGNSAPDRIQRQPGTEADKAEYQWVQCSAVEPRRCLSVAWLTRGQVATSSAAVTSAKRNEAKRADSQKDSAATSKSADQGEKKETSLDQVLGVVATVLAVVLGVTTLIATKTASDARNEVREELERLDAAKQAQAGALHSQAAMLTAMLVQARQQLVQKHYQPGEVHLVDATILISLLKPLTKVLYSLAGLSSARRDVDGLVRTLDKVIDQIRLSPPRRLSEAVLSMELRQMLRDISELLFQHRTKMDQSGRSLTESESNALERLALLGRLLQDT